MSVIPETIWVLTGEVHYEGSDILAICESEAIVLMFKQEWESRKDSFFYDSYEIKEYPLFTGAKLMLGLQEITTK